MRTRITERLGAGLLVVALMLPVAAPSAAAEDDRGVRMTAGNGAVAPAERRVALVIGNGAYRNAPPLANPPNDARTVAEAVRAAGFELVSGKVMLDLDRAGTEQAIRAFGQQLRGGAIGLFYYAGHGVQISGANYLVPVSANLSSEADVKYELVDVNYVLDEMTHAGNRLNMVILDACRNNPFGGRGMRSTSSGLAQMQAPSGTVISYATQPGNVAADGSGGNSPFTEALATSIRKPGRSVFEVFNDVGIAVKKKTGGVQQPWLATSPIEGQFYFVPGAEPAPAPAAAPAPVAALDPLRLPAVSADKEALYWETIKDSRNPAFYRAYLEQFPAGVFAGLARAKLAAIPPAAAAPARAPAPAAAALPFDVAKVPFLSDSQKAGLAGYQSGAVPKALAVGSTGSYAFQTNANGDLTEADARRRVLERCQYYNHGPCILYSVNGTVASADGRSLPTIPVTIKSSGAFDPAQVPFVSQTVRDTKMKSFAAARQHKALALHASGAWATVSGRDSVDTAIEAALETCGTYKEQGCFIYAQDDEIVYDGAASAGSTASATKPRTIKAVKER
ncbi:MAG: caspase family protein [Rhodospirillaceae bacterium]